MNSVTREEFQLRFDEFKMLIEDGCLFIHPTDTIYGLGCDATNKQSVKKIRDLKNKHEGPFSVIVPDKSWIFENCHITPNARAWIDKLPGPYTLILPLKHRDSVAHNVNFGLESIGVRMPKHWILGYVEKLGVPIVTTTANKMGENFANSPEHFHPDISSKVDFVIFEDEKICRPSMLVDLTGEEEVLIKR